MTIDEARSITASNSKVIQMLESNTLSMFPIPTDYGDSYVFLAMTPQGQPVYGMPYIVVDKGTKQVRLMNIRQFTMRSVKG